MDRLDALDAPEQMVFDSLGEQMAFDALTPAEQQALIHQYKSEKEQQSYEEWRGEQRQREEQQRIDLLREQFWSSEAGKRYEAAATADAAQRKRDWEKQKLVAAEEEKQKEKRMKIDAAKARREDKAEAEAVRALQRDRMGALQKGNHCLLKDVKEEE